MIKLTLATTAVQGIGGGGILSLTEIITSDLVPLAERGLFQGIVGLVWALACGVGPPIVSIYTSTALRLSTQTYFSAN